MNAEKHVTVLGALLIAYGILGAIFMIVILAVFGLGAALIEEPGMAFLSSGIGIGIGIAALSRSPSCLRSSLGGAS